VAAGELFEVITRVRDQRLVGGNDWHARGEGAGDQRARGIHASQHFDEDVQIVYFKSLGRVDNGHARRAWFGDVADEGPNECQVNARGGESIVLSASGPDDGLADPPAAEETDADPAQASCC
jgi:hypothetical protein